MQWCTKDITVEIHGGLAWMDGKSAKAVKVVQCNKLNRCKYGSG